MRKTPHEIGLPEQFDQWRPVQEQMIDVFMTSYKRALSLCAPTGSGKSPFSIAAALLSGVPTCIVTATRGLQTQYMDDFESIGLVDIRGRGNYSCHMKEDYTCEEGYAARCPYKGSVACPSSQAEMRAATSNLVVTNYDKWTAARRFGTGMSHFKHVIFDEAHEMPNAVAKAMQVILNHKEIEETLKIDFLKYPWADDFANWKIWAIEARNLARSAMESAFSRIKNLRDPRQSWVRHYLHMRNLVRRLAILATANPEGWVVDEIEKGYQFDPIFLGKYGEAALLLRVPKITAISATLRPKTMYMVGLGKDKFDFHEFDSDFDPKRSPIYYIPTMRVDERNRENIQILWNRIDQIIARRRDRKGIIHTVSYERQKQIRQASRFWESMIINEKGEPPTEKIEQFMNAGPGTILVSPAVGTGYDFKDDYCRFQFMCKIPFEPPSKIVKAREHEDPEYRGYKAIQALVQAFGRDTRSKSDWSERFIADDHVRWFLPRFAHLAPRSFHMFYREVNILPQPPKLEDMK